MINEHGSFVFYKNVFILERNNRTMATSSISLYVDRRFIHCFIQNTNVAYLSKIRIHSMLQKSPENITYLHHTNEATEERANVLIKVCHKDKQGQIYHIYCRSQTVTNYHVRALLQSNQNIKSLRLINMYASLRMKILREYKDLLIRKHENVCFPLALLPRVLMLTRRS